MPNTAAAPAEGRSADPATRLLDVVIVAWRSPDLLRACLRTLLENLPAGGDTVVHVVDNASGDGTPNMVAAEFAAVHLHRLPENAGFSAANNVILRESTAEYALVLNPDTEIREGVLDHLITLLREREDVGIVGCRLVQPDGTFDHAAKRSFPTPASALAHFTGIGRRLTGGSLAQYRATEIDEHDVGEVDALNGAFMLVRHQALRDVGLFDEGYWLYMEDLDWCARFWERGWKVLYDGSVTALHVKGGSAGKHRAWKTNLHFHRGMGRFYRRHQAGKNTALDTVVYAGIGAKLAASASRSWWARLRVRERLKRVTGRRPRRGS